MGNHAPGRAGPRREGQHEYIQLDEVLDIAELSKTGDVTITLQDISGQQITGNIFNLSVVSQA